MPTQDSLQDFAEQIEGKHGSAGVIALVSAILGPVNKAELDADQALLAKLRENDIEE
jgi:hypothetical protein